MVDWKRAVGSGGAVDGLESCGGREYSGKRHLQAIKAESDKKPSENPPRWWVERMANVLRDEDSGICFRCRYGFCSTGSQISWLTALSDQSNGGGDAAFHYFTGASDPLCGTPYKLFRFLDPIPSGSEDDNTQHDHGTKTLWDLWRKRAISRAKLDAPMRDALSKMEEESLSDCGPSDPKKQSTFADMVQREIELLEDGSR